MKYRDTKYRRTKNGKNGNRKHRNKKHGGHRRFRAGKHADTDNGARAYGGINH